MVGAPGTEAGGIGGLVAFLREHGAAVEADLQRFYDADLSDLTTGRLTWRRLAVLIAGLPRESVTVQEVNGPDLAWGLAEHLLAFIGDGIQAGNWQRSGGKGKPPKPTPRPGVQDGLKRVGRVTRTPAEARAYLERLKPREANDGV